MKYDQSISHWKWDGEKKGKRKRMNDLRFESMSIVVISENMPDEV